MLAALMTAHVLVIHVDVAGCQAHKRYLLEQRRPGRTPIPQASIPDLVEAECANLEGKFRSVVDQWVSVILSLLGGAGVAAAMSKPPTDQTGR
jgi:hypothetical protein